MKIQRTLFANKLDDFGRKREPWTVRTRAVKRLEVVREFCSTVFVDFSESLGKVRVELNGSGCQE